MPRPPRHPLPVIAAALRRHRGVVAAAAAELGVARQALSGLIARTPALADAQKRARPMSGYAALRIGAALGVRLEMEGHAEAAEAVQVLLALAREGQRRRAPRVGRPAKKSPRARNIS